jgi:hypothetical protein
MRRGSRASGVRRHWCEKGSETQEHLWPKFPWMSASQPMLGKDLEVGGSQDTLTIHNCIQFYTPGDFRENSIALWQSTDTRACFGPWIIHLDISDSLIVLSVALLTQKLHGPYHLLVSSRMRLSVCSSVVSLPAGVSMVPGPCVV